MSISKLNPIFILAIISLCGVFQATNSKSKKKFNGLHLRMIHIDSPESPTYEPELTDIERINRLLIMSDYRIQYLVNKTSQRQVEPDMASLPIRRQSLLYYVQIGIGQFNDVHQPYHNNYLVFDTSTDVIWTQCQDCRHCFRQRFSLFPNRKSQTYRPFTYTECHPSIWRGDHCEFYAQYEDGTEMRGIWAHETFTFTSMSSINEPINGIDFVCAIDTYNNPTGKVDGNNIITGTLGMSKSEKSLFSQLGSKVQYKFSYCFQDFGDHDGQYPPMFLSFGDQISQPPIMYATPIFTIRHPLAEQFYYVNLVGISVDDTLLFIPPHLFASNINDYVGATIFDTVATLTHLASPAFDILLNAIIEYVTQHNIYLKRRTDILPDKLEACWEPLYDLAPVHFPKITFHFEKNADLIVQPQEMFPTLSGIPGVHLPGLSCLTVARTFDGGFNVIGAYQQINQRVIVDMEKSLLLFAPADCTSDTH
ncbi:hypothetical protein RND81_04G119700 [Saponaria officinalis]|uniref:Peptidase A1 domain-containing protein n=1 Tax=Saponaria officinalis TaxID=3572 RepID=A0AAW1LK39_SAPOF